MRRAGSSNEHGVSVGEELLKELLEKDKGEEEEGGEVAVMKDMDMETGRDGEELDNVWAEEVEGKEEEEGKVVIVSEE